MNGILLVDKPADWTSHDVVAKLRGVLGERRMGHSGTLDPMATGLLVVFAGRATRAVSFSENHSKCYEARLRLGLTTDTQDTTGTVLSRCDRRVTRAELEAVLPQFRGDILQVPPMYSALKRDGKPLYEYARAGIEVEREARKVTIHALELLDFSGDRFTLRVSCSKGTYVRSLAMDIGAALGCGAHLCGLRRTRIGAFELDAAVTLAALEACEFEARAAMLAPVDALLAVHARIVLDGEQAQGLLQGRVLSLAGAGGEGLVRVYGPKGFLGLGQWQDGDKLAARRLIATDGGVLDASA